MTSSIYSRLRKTPLWLVFTRGRSLPDEESVKWGKIDKPTSLPTQINPETLTEALLNALSQVLPPSAEVYRESTASRSARDGASIVILSPASIKVTAHVSVSIQPAGGYSLIEVQQLLAMSRPWVVILGWVCSLLLLSGLTVAFMTAHTGPLLFALVGLLILLMVFSWLILSPIDRFFFEHRRQAAKRRARALRESVMQAVMAAASSNTGRGQQRW